MNISTHAAERMNQRGLYPIHVDLLERFGKIDFHRGRDILSFNKKSRRELRKYLGPKLVKELLNTSIAYLVKEDGVLVTVARKNINFKKRKY